MVFTTDTRIPSGKTNETGDAAKPGHSRSVVKAPAPKITTVKKISNIVDVRNAANPEPLRNVGATRKCPSEEDEPNFLVKLFGNNEVLHGELWGWTNAICAGFPTLKSSLIMKELEMNADGSLPDVLVPLNSFSETLEYYSKYSSEDYRRVNCPIFVQVIAKKKVDIITKKLPVNSPKDPALCSLLLIGNLIVADKSGACLFTCFNESVEIIHDKVEVGDYLAIDKATYRRPPQSTIAACGNPFGIQLLQLEIKVDKYNVRQLYHVPYKSNSMIKLTNSSNLFRSEDKLWTPSAIVDNNGFELLSPMAAVAAENSASVPPERKRDLKFFDIIGYVSYVGRMERLEIYRENYLCYDVEKEIYRHQHPEEQMAPVPLHLPLRQFIPYRWIQLVDKASKKPLLIKLYLKKETIKLQEKLIPGALLVLTHCVVNEFQPNYLESFVTSSIYSSIYMEEELIKMYFKMVPNRYLLSVADHINAEACKQTLNRQDIIWSAGGTIEPKIKSREKFVDYFQAAFPVPKRGLADTKNKRRYERREVNVFFFRGVIQGVQKITEEKGPNGIIEKVHGFAYGSDAGIRANTERWPIIRGCRSNWFFYRRRLPSWKLTDTTRTQSMIAEIKKLNEKYCSPLLFPCVYPPVEENEATPLSTCAKLDGPPYYRVIIKDEEDKQWFVTIFRDFPKELMEKKLMAAEGKVIIGIIDVYSLEGVSSLDVVLRDFVIEKLEVEDSSEVKSQEVRQGSNGFDGVGGTSTKSQENDAGSCSNAHQGEFGVSPRVLSHHKSEDEERDLKDVRQALNQKSSENSENVDPDQLAEDSKQIPEKKRKLTPSERFPNVRVPDCIVN